MTAGGYSSDEDKIILEMRTIGESNHVIAAALGRSLDSVKGRVKALIRNELISSRGTTIRKYGLGGRLKRWNDEDISELKRLRLSGEPYSVIASKLDRTIDAVQQMSIRLMKADEDVERRTSPIDKKAYILDSEIARIGLMLWWAEGTKKGRNVQFVNSSPEMIKVYLLFLKEIGVDVKRLSAKVKVMNSLQVGESQKYWSKITGIPLGNFTKPIIRGRVVEEKYSKHMGCLTITYCSINLKRQMETKLKNIIKDVLSS